MRLSLTQVGKAVALVFCLILLLLGVDLANTIHDNDYQAAGVIDYMTRNFNSNPIYEIVSISNTEICPDAYELISIGNWSGTYEGCSKGFLGLYFGSCLIGTTIPATAPVPLYQWNQTQFCVKRNQNFSYTSDHCSEGYISCPNSLCVSSNESCPITSIVNESSVLPGDDYTEFQGGYLIFDNEAGIAIFSIEISLISPVPCYAQGWNPADNDAYILDINNFNGCGFAGQDNKVNIFAQMDEDSLYNENNLQDTINSLPGYVSSINNDQVYLVGRESILLVPTPECNQTQYQTNQYILPELQELITYQDDIVNFFEYEIFLILVSISLVIKKADKKLDIAYTVLTFLDIIYFIYISSIITSHANAVVNFNMPYGPLADNQCFYDTVFSDGISYFNQFQSSFPSSIKDRIIIIFVVLGLRNILNIIVTLMGLRAARAKKDGKQKSIMADLYSIFCICFALTGGDE